MEMSNVFQLRQPEPQEETQDGLSLSDLKDFFREAEDALEKERNLAARDERFYHNFDDDQWTEAEKRELSFRGQPTYTHNAVKKQVNTLRGVEQRSRTDPKALPRRPEQQLMATVATDVLNYLDDVTDFDQVASRSFPDLAIRGVEAVEPIWNEDERAIEVNFIKGADFFRDPKSSDPQFLDANYLGYAKWMDLDRAKKMYPDYADKMQETVNDRTSGYDDRPSVMWVSTQNRRKRIRIIVMYYKDERGTWRLAHFCGSCKLFDQESPYVEQLEGGRTRPRCNIIAAALYLDDENRAYGVVRDMIGPQQEENHLRSKKWALANNRRSWSREGVLGEDQIPAFKRELSRVDGHVTAPGPFGEAWGLIDSSQEYGLLSDLQAGALAEQQKQSPQAALAGRNTEGMSGRAIGLQQGAAMTEENTIFDCHGAWKERVFKCFWDIARQFWTDERYVRVAGEEDGFKFIELNKPVGFDPMTGQVIRKNDMSRMDADIVLEQVADVAVLQQEQFRSMVELAQVGVEFTPEEFLQASDIRDKDKMLKKRREQAEQQAPMQQAAMQLEAREKAANAAKDEAGAALDQARTVNEALEARGKYAKQQLGIIE